MAEERSISFYEIHTKETATITYKRDGEYLPEGMEQINHIMRDWRRDEPTKMDPELIDLIWEIHRDLGSKEPIHLISGYRSKKTNEKLRRRRGGQARKSQHILGKAADIHFPDVSIKTLRNSALIREVGGVGYYPKSGIPFVHVDTGRVRHWPRIPRMELAALFPDGKSKHVPSDGKPITLADARRAIASGKYPGPPEPVQPVMVAQATPEPAPSAPAATSAAKSKAPAKAPVMTAGLGSDSLAAFMRAAGITGSIPEPVAPPPGHKGSAMMQLASASSTGGMTLLPAMDTSLPLPETAASAPQYYDEEHPEELAYEPFSVLPLMDSTPVSRDVRMVSLVAPDFDNADYLLSHPERRLALELTPQVGVQHIAAAWQFTGSAVRNLLPKSEPAQRPEPQGRVMTASSPAPMPLGGSVGFSSGGGSGFGYR